MTAEEKNIQAVLWLMDGLNTIVRQNDIGFARFWAAFVARKVEILLKEDRMASDHEIEKHLRDLIVKQTMSDGAHRC